MRSVALLVLLAGCDLFFPLRDPPGGEGIALRGVFSDSVVDETRLRIDRPLDVEPDDLLLAVIKADGEDDLVLMDMPVGMTVLTQTSANGCPNEVWTVWFLSGRAGTLERYEFQFERLPRQPPDGESHSGMIAAYKNAGSPMLIKQINAGDLVDDSLIVQFAEGQGEPGSMIWLGAVADSPWTSLFSEGTKAGIEENVAMFELASPDGVIPPMSYDLPKIADEFCPGIAQVRIDPIAEL